MKRPLEYTLDCILQPGFPLGPGSSVERVVSWPASSLANVKQDPVPEATDEDGLFPALQATGDPPSRSSSQGTAQSLGFGGPGELQHCQSSPQGQGTTWGPGYRKQNKPDLQPLQLWAPGKWMERWGQVFSDSPSQGHQSWLPGKSRIFTPQCISEMLGV